MEQQCTQRGELMDGAGARQQLCTLAPWHCAAQQVARSGRHMLSQTQQQEAGGSQRLSREAGEQLCVLWRVGGGSSFLGRGQPPAGDASGL